MKKVLLINQGNTDNLGDQAIYIVLKTFLESKNNKVDFIPFWSEKEVFGKFWETNKSLVLFLMKFPFVVDFFNYKRIKKACDKIKYDTVVIGGGELLCAHHGFNSSLKCFTKYFKNKNIPIKLIGVSGDLNMRKLYRNRFRESLLRCTYVSVRDGFTKEICENYYKLKIDLFPDVVFAYNKILKKKPNIHKEQSIVFAPISFNKEVSIGLGLDIISEYTEYLKNLLLENLKEGNNIILTATTKDDYIFVKELYTFLLNEFKGYKIEIKKMSSLEEYIDLVKTSKLVISGRMHAMIIGLIQKNKVVPIEFKTKLKKFNEEYGGDILIEEIENKAYEGLNKLI
ncbi:hypothetical protein Aargi30884_24250 [Amedibacterium intestinale]|uniref:Polysaccharide pyruvyl transferase domain-containing protein n=1 Tax=Amedibacterium intestinale TaxID=2583452 RepID=A0A6N4TN81_9FIRM|nr:polysaccharide pyruvyl transferase family protein [Amedibacterium intestinale]BBK23522.1 hypothetical protein Aargi30884_24250 [Amedibacterium intestinale]